MVLLPDGRILLSGGATVDDTCVPVYHKDLRQLDTETMLWSKAKTTGGKHVLVLASAITACVQQLNYTETERSTWCSCDQTRNGRIFRVIDRKHPNYCSQQASGYLHGVITP